MITKIALLGLIYSNVNNPGWLNKRYPATGQLSTASFGVSAQSTGDALTLTEEELKAYDGTDPEKPNYLAIDGLIFDVSPSPSLYGPRGHYHHFVGKDATRAWVTECWNEPEQFTWRMDDVEVMFTPKWLDEQMENLASGGVEDGMDGSQGGQAVEMAQKIIDRFGKVSDKEKAQRREQDAKEAKAKVKETLDHWVAFFQGNEKYKQVGRVIRDESRAVPPKPCEEAMKKRPLSAGKLEALSADLGNLMGGAKVKAKEKMPDSVQQNLKGKKKEKEEAGINESHDEL